MRRQILPLLLVVLFLASCTKRKPEEIDYAPNLPYDPYPPDSSTNIDHTTLDVTLSWKAYDRDTDDVMTYNVFFDTLNPPMTSIASGLSSASFFVTGLNYNTTYYWKVFAADQAGTTTASIVWRFTTLPHANSAPTMPAYFYPVDNAPWQFPTLGFAWNSTDPEGASDTLYYDFYLGVTQQPPLIPSKNDYFSLTRDITGLNYTTTYYWKVVARDNHYAYTSGPLYSFVTRDCPWFYKKELPSPRCGFGTAVVNGKIYVIGGIDGANYLSEVLEYDPALDTWVRKADMPTPRSDLVVTAWNGKIYAMGGRTSMAFYCNNEVYDPLSDVWNTLAPVPLDISGTSAHAIKGKIYTAGPIMQYNITTNDWWDTAFVHFDTVWVDTFHTIIDSIFPDTIYSPIKSNLPHAHLFYCSAVYNNLIYVMGGTDGYGFSPFVDVYHPGTNLWTSASDMISPANYSAAAMANGFIYVLGGNDGTYSKRVRKYDPATDTWHIRSDLQTGRAYFGAAFTGGYIYAIGGISTLLTSAVEEYRLDLDPKNTK